MRRQGAARGHVHADSLTWRRDFIRTYVEREALQFRLRLSPELLRRLWTMLTYQQGGLLNSAAHFYRPSAQRRWLVYPGQTSWRIADDVQVVPLQDLMTAFGNINAADQLNQHRRDERHFIQFGD